MRSAAIAAAVTVFCGIATASTTSAAETDNNDPQVVAAKIDKLLNKAIKKAGATPAPLASDEDFLRRVCLDLVGLAPSARQVTEFRSRPNSDKRSQVIDRLIDSEQFARNWARYWRDVVMSRATDQRARLAQRAFESWLAEQFQQNRSWDAVVTDLITATGDVRETGEAALIFAHNGDAKEIAAEVSRIFLGIQIQCANCHDHPTDVWKRKQFHELAAYFPRMRVRPVRDPERNRIRSWEVVSAEYGRRRGFLPDPSRFLRDYDKNKDGKVTKADVKGTRLERVLPFLLRRIDRNRDEAISKEEMERAHRSAMRMRRRRGGVEYYMPDLENPSSRGTRVAPAFFVGSVKSEFGMKDLERRGELAKLLTAKDNKWFARAFVNRIWGEMLGEGFYMPIDDLGPQRYARFENVLNELADRFTANGYDVKWLFRVIANTDAYQRQIRAKDASDTSPPFASATPTRLRGDQIYNALTQSLGVRSLSGSRFGRRRRFGGGGYRRFGGDRFLVTRLFNFDPSTPQADIVGTVPQALYLMNSPSLNNLIRGTGRTRLAGILRDNPKDEDALKEVYLMVHSREPSEKEVKICTEYIAKVGRRSEAFEDILWSLLNSSEFLTKR